MTEQPLHFMREVAERNYEAIAARRAPHNKAFGGRANAIVNAPQSVGSKIAALWKLADDGMAFNEGNVPCKRGCSHCCHIEVSVFEPEAKVIGQRLGRAPAAPKRRQCDAGFDFGYHNPCPFLQGNECGIYAFRPMACRTYFSLYQDDTPCRLKPGEDIYVPSLDTTDLKALLAVVCGAGRGRAPRFADIREWFPAPP